MEVMLVAHKASRHRLTFVPHSAPLVRGIFATVQFEWPETAGGVSTASLTEIFRRYYASSPIGARGGGHAAAGLGGGQQLLRHLRGHARAAPWR